VRRNKVLQSSSGRSSIACSSQTVEVVGRRLRRFCGAVQLPLLDHVCRFDACDDSGGGAERLGPHHRQLSPLDRPIILLNEGSQVLRLARLNGPADSCQQTATAACWRRACRWVSLLESH
jgi:hypothetical protein